jgi:hypothetical protein
MNERPLKLWTVRDPCARRHCMTVSIEHIVVAFDRAQAIRLVSDVESRLGKPEARPFDAGGSINFHPVTGIIERMGQIGIVPKEWYR